MTDNSETRALSKGGNPQPEPMQLGYPSLTTADVSGGGRKVCVTTVGHQITALLSAWHRELDPQRESPKGLALSTTHLKSAPDGSPIREGTIYFCTIHDQMQISSLCWEMILLLITDMLKHPVILGISWLHLQDPHISWPNCKITRWSEYCKENHLQCPCIPQSSKSIEILETPINISVPEKYHDFQDVLYSVRPRQTVYPLTDPRTVQLTSFQAFHLLAVAFTHYHALLLLNLC